MPIHGVANFDNPGSVPNVGHTRTKFTVAGMDWWIDWSGTKPELPEVRDYINPPPARRKAEAAAAADAALAATGTGDPLRDRDHAELVLIRRLVKQNQALLAILQTKGTLTAADLAAIKKAGE